MSAVEAMTTMYAQVWDSLIPVIGAAHTDGAAPMPPGPWADQPLEVQLEFMREASAPMLGLANLVLRVSGPS